MPAGPGPMPCATRGSAIPHGTVYKRGSLVCVRVWVLDCFVVFAFRAFLLSSNQKNCDINRC